MLPVRLQNLSKHFGATVAVEGVDLEIPAGSLFFLLGPSGCGKTTLLRMIAGFIEPTAGTIRFGQREVTHLPPNQRHTGMCFQSYALWPHMTVQQNVAFGLQVRKAPAAEQTRRVGAALELVQMTAYAQRKPNELSGGQQQRVALARALVIEPDVLLLDEPLSNLDAKLRLEMRSQLKQICQAARITTIYVTHDQKEALSMAEGMAVLREGRVAQVGSPAELYNRPGSRFVADFLGESNFLEATVAARDDGTVVLETAAGRLHAAVFPATVAAGDRVTCSVRPEAVHLRPPAQGEATGPVNRVEGRRVERVYLGEVAQHQVEVGGGTRFKVFELNPRGGDGPDESAGAMTLWFDARSVVVLAG